MDNNLDSNVPEQLRDVFVGKSTASEQNQNLAGKEDTVTETENKTTQGEKEMENKPELKEVVRAEVQSYFAEKDAQEKVEARITGLETEKAEQAKQIEKLTASEKALAEKVSVLEKEKETLESEKVSLASEKEAAETKASEATAELESIKREQVTAARKDELEKDGVLLSDEEMQAKQVAKISDMTDESFAEYKAELVALAKCAEDNKKKKEEEETQKKSKAETEAAEAEKVEAAKASVQENAGDPSRLFAQALASAQNPTCDANNVELYSQL